MFLQATLQNIRWCICRLVANTIFSFPLESCWLLAWIFPDVSTWSIDFHSIYFWEREYIHMWVGGGEEEERESQVDFLLSMEPTVWLSLRTLWSWPETKSGIGQSTQWATQGPHLSLLRFFRFSLNFSMFRTFPSNKFNTESWHYLIYFQDDQIQCFCLLHWFHPFVARETVRRKLDIYISSIYIFLIMCFHFTFPNLG